MKDISYKIDEEITRWTFEVIMKNSEDWFIAFTNPTAGPWKRIEASSNILGEIHEVYRFDIDEPRPDLIIYNDDLQLIIIFEAKKRPQELIKPSQIINSCEVIINMTEKLSASDADVWKSKTHYKVLMGLLWFEDPNISEKEIFDVYSEELNKQLSKHPNLNKLILNDFLISIITKQDNKNLTCHFNSNNHDNSLHDILNSSLL